MKHESNNDPIPNIDLTTSEANFAELLILLIEAYVHKPDFIHPVATSPSLPGL
jgi:hypothetical protein